MKKFITQFYAIDQTDGEVKLWSGQRIEAPTHNLATEWCKNNAPYLYVVGELVGEIDYDSDKEVDWEKINQN